MSEQMLGVFVIIMGVVILNVAAAGMVSGLFFWRSMRGVTKRAFLGSALTGSLLLLMVSGGVWLEASYGSDGALAATLGTIVIYLMGFVITLPGALIMSRKIAKTDALGDTFE